VLIVDDEPAARRRLRSMVEELGEDVVGEADSGDDALSLARELEPDVLLLDIVMPEVDGLDVARHLPEPRPLIIFQTAHSDYALEAFEHEAVDFVVKPVRAERLEKALERARRRMEQPPRPAISNELLEQIGSRIGPTSSATARRLLVLDGTGHRVLRVREILLFTTDGRYVWAHTAPARFATTYTLGELERRLGAGFVRTSRAELVAIEHVQRVESLPEGGLLLKLASGQVVRVSRRRAAEVRRLLEA
jgi:two-component system LytT family response regulator